MGVRSRSARVVSSLLTLKLGALVRSPSRWRGTSNGGCLDLLHNPLNLGGLWGHWEAMQLLLSVQGASVGTRGARMGASKGAKGAKLGTRASTGAMGATLHTWEHCMGARGATSA